MGRNDWEDVDDDLAALAGRSRSKLSVKQIWPQLLGIAGVTFATAYYLPMHRAHRALTNQHAVALQRSDELGHQLEQTQEKLRKSEQRAGELARKVDAADARAKRRAEELSALKERLSSALARPMRSGAVAIAEGDRGVVVSIAPGDVFLPNKLDVSPKGKDLICDVARAAGEQELNVSASAAARELAPPALRLALRNRWALGGAKAAAVVDTLEKGCRVPVARLQSAAPAGSTDGQDGRIRIEIPVASVD